MNYSQKLVPISIAMLLLVSCNDRDHKHKTNTPPVAVSATVSTHADTLYSGLLSGTDTDMDKLSFTVATAPTNGLLTLHSDGHFSYLPSAEFTGSDTFSFTVSDGMHASIPASVSITVDNLTVSFNDYSRKAFQQMATDTPLPLNGRTVTQDVSAENAYDDLLTP